MESFIIAQSGPDVGLILLTLLITFGVLIALGIVMVKALVCCKIFARAGYCWALGLLMFVPIANIIMAFVLVFSEWPIQRRLWRLEQVHGQ
jgi:hypothetical protein